MQRIIRTGGSGSTNTHKRSSYVSNLRRAFLLRAHPDRFRRHSQTIRKAQGDLISSISERLSKPDFLSYTSAAHPTATEIQSWENAAFTIANTGVGHTRGLGGKEKKGARVVRYHLERKDGTLLKRSIDLDGSVLNVLDCIDDDLKALGVATPPRPILPAAAPEDNHRTQHERYSWDQYQHQHPHHKDSNGTAPKGINHRYDVISRQGRNLTHFLSHLDPSDVLTAKSQRLDASAAALVARRTYGFQSIDGTRMGWSSASLTKLLQTLTSLHDDHSHTFLVSSFYPFRLLFSPEDSFTLTGSERIDVFGGTICLNPTWTPTQWLDVLQAVTPDSMTMLKRNQRLLSRGLETLHSDESGWLPPNTRIIRGYSCSSAEYHGCVLRMVSYLHLLESDGHDVGLIRNRDTHVVPVVTVTTPTTEDITIPIVIESPQSCRRAVVTSQGSIRVGSGMDAHDIGSGVAQRYNQAATAKRDETHKLDQVSLLFASVQNRFRLTRIRKMEHSIVTTDQIRDCLNRLLELGDIHQHENEHENVWGSNPGVRPETTKQRILGRLAGHSVRITSTGNFCHLGDDGSIVIPWDWR